MSYIYCNYEKSTLRRFKNNENPKIMSQNFKVYLVSQKESLPREAKLRKIDDKVKKVLLKDFYIMTKKF